MASQEMFCSLNKYRDVTIIFYRMYPDWEESYPLARLHYETKILSS